MTATDADRALFDETLVCLEEMPARFRAGDLRDVSRAKGWERAEQLLRVIALVEESDASETEERGAVELGLQRLESKLNLVLELVGSLVRQSLELPAPTAVDWSRHGAKLARSEPYSAGAEGWLTLYPLPWLPQPLDLPARVVHCAPAGEDATLWLEFVAPSGGVEAAIERHLFRRHRRAVALARRAR